MTAHTDELADPVFVDDRLSHWAETNPDVNRDGVVNQQDATLKERLKIWRREGSTQPWIRTPSLVNVPSQECELDLTGFTRYAVAY